MLLFFTWVVRTARSNYILIRVLVTILQYTMNKHQARISIEEVVKFLGFVQI